MPNLIEEKLRIAEEKLSQEEFDSAISLFSEILATNAQHQKALSGLKYIEYRNIFLNSRCYMLSQAELRELIELFHQKQFQQVLATCELLSEKNPNHPLILLFQGHCHAEVGNFEIALSLYTQAINTNANSAELYCSIGNVLRKLGKLSEAIANYKCALEKSPNYAAAHGNLGNALSEIGKYQEAVNCYKKAISFNPSSSILHHNLGIVLHNSGLFEDAVRSYRNSIEIDPMHAAAHCNLGISLRFIGRIAEARDSFRSAINVDPNYADAHRQLSNVTRFNCRNEDLEAIEKAYAEADLSNSEKMLLSFALGKAYDDLHQHEKAFSFYVQGNSIKRSSFSFSIEQASKVIQRINDACSPNIVEKFKEAGLPDRTPIFIVGMPRSGTTLVEQILSSHSDVEGGGELPYLQQTISSQFADISHSNFGNSLASASHSDFSDAGRQYVKLIRKNAKNLKHVTDKLPLNFHLIGVIKLVLPDAKIINCKRNPIDTCISIFKNYFESTGNFFAYDLEELGQYYNLYLEQMTYWHSLFPDSIYDIRYEDLISDQESQTRALLEYCSLRWEDACLDFHKNRRAVQTASATQVREKLYSDSINSWRRYEKWLTPLLESLENRLQRNM